MALVPLLWAQGEVGPRRALVLGLLAGSVANLITFRWMFALITAHASIPWPLAGLLTGLLAVQQGLMWGLWLALAGRMGTLWAYPVTWVVLEHFYPVMFRVYLANYLHDSLWFSQCLDLAGPGLLSFVIVAVNVGLWDSWRAGKTTRMLVQSGVLLAVILAYGVVRVGQVEAGLRGVERLKVGVVENDIGIARDFQVAQEAHRRLLELSARARVQGVELLVFPETAVKLAPPPHQVQGEAGLRGALARTYPLGGVYFDPGHPASPQFGVGLPLLMGVVTEDAAVLNPASGRPARFNTALLLDGRGYVLGRALKNHLLLFGEQIPGAQWFPGIYRRFLPRASKLVAGQKPGVLEFQGHRLGVSICYEDLLPGFNYRLAQQGPELLVNLTNDAWFGEGIEPLSHLFVSKARSIELRRFMVRATCTGVSAVIDPLGRVVQRSSGEGPQLLVNEVAWLQGSTLFARVGNLFCWVCLAWMLWWIQPVMSRLRPK